MIPLQLRRAIPKPMHSLGCCVSVALLLVGCGPDNQAAEGEALTVFAAASCADWVTDLVKLPSTASLRLQFGPSSGLARQIADGAPADVFITAHKRWIEYLIEADRVDGQPISFAYNSLVCVALKSTTFEGPAPRNLGSLADALQTDDRIAIADESVPAGDYTRQALTSANLLPTLKPYFVGQDDARSTLRAIAQGQAKVGFVYASDAQLASLQSLFTLDPSTHETINYWACAIRGRTQNTQALVFIESLQSVRVQDLLQRSGFSPK
ncbi:MAG: molybdate ABC transporter substrate-binding protein [bacterium]|nr:molybdate ABC transporter substrate-binding protein [bacterium]